MDELERLKLEMDSRGFSYKTKKSYTYFVGDFLRYTNKSHSEIQEDDIKSYISYLIMKRGYTNITANLAISSLKFFLIRSWEVIFATG